MATGIPSLNPYLYRTYANYGAIRAVDMVNSTSPQQYSLDTAFNNVKILSTLSTSKVQLQQSDFRQQLVDFNNAAKKIGTAAKAFDSGNSVFERKYVTADTAAITGEAKSSAKAAQYDIGVTQLAVGQRNTSVSLASNSLGGLSAGTYTLGITSGSGAEKQVSFAVGATDSNSQALNKISTAINKANLGIRAEVKTSGNQSYLNLESRNTGTANAFSLRDISGNAASALTLNNSAQAAKDAQYIVNGANYESASNAVAIDNGNGNVNLTLRGLTAAGTAKVVVGADTAKTVAAVKTLVESYNEMNDIINSAGNATKRFERLLAGIQGEVSGIQRRDYSNIGISFDKTSGTLSLDEEKLTKAITQNQSGVKSLLSGRSGLSGMAAALAATAADTPVSAFFKPPDVRDILGINAVQGRNSASSILGRNSLQGLFLDMMI